MKAYKLLHVITCSFEFRSCSIFMTDESRVIFETAAGASSRRYSRSQSDIWDGPHVPRAWLGTARCSDHLGKLEWPHLMYKHFYYQLELHWITVSCKGLRQNYHNWHLDDFMDFFLEFFHWLESILCFQKLRPLTWILSLVSNSKSAQKRFEGRATGWEWARSFERLL